MDCVILKPNDRICLGPSAFFLFKNKADEENASMPDTDEDPITFDDASEEIVKYDTKIEEEEQKLRSQEQARRRRFEEEELERHKAEMSRRHHSEHDHIRHECHAFRDEQLVILFDHRANWEHHCTETI